MAAKNTEEAIASESRRRRRRRRGNRALHYIVLLVFVFVALAALSLTVLFKVERVTVVGTDKYPPDQVARASGIHEGENLFRIDKSAAIQNILEQYPYIEAVEVRRRLPGTVQIDVTQCRPAAAIADGDEFLLITRGGKVLERGLIFIPEDTPLVSGFGAQGARPGDSLAESAGEQLVMLGYLFDAVDQTGFGEITNVDLSDRLNMKVVYENRLVLELGTEADLPYKLDFIREMIENHLAADAEGIIDATNAQKSRVSFTEMPLARALEGKTERDKPGEPPAPEPDIDEPKAESGAETASSG